MHGLDWGFISSGIWFAHIMDVSLVAFFMFGPASLLRGALGG